MDTLNLQSTKCLVKKIWFQDVETFKTVAKRKTRKEIKSCVEEEDCIHKYNLHIMHTIKIGKEGKRTKILIIHLFQWVNLNLCVCFKRVICLYDKSFGVWLSLCIDVTKQCIRVNLITKLFDGEKLAIIIILVWYTKATQLRHIKSFSI